MHARLGVLLSWFYDVGSQRQSQRRRHLSPDGSLYTAPSRKTDGGVRSLYSVGIDLGLHCLQRGEFLAGILHAHGGQRGLKMCQYWDDLSGRLC